MKDVAPIERTVKMTTPDDPNIPHDGKANGKQGKKQGNQNAIKHGIYSALAASVEDSEEFKALLSEVTEDLNPQGPIQKDKARSIALNIERKREIERYRKVKILQWYDQRFDQLVQFVQNAKAEKSLSELRLPKDVWEICEKSFPREDCDSEATWVKQLAYAVGIILREVDEERELFFEKGIANGFCSKDDIAAELDLEERIDRKIDKDIVSFGRMKTMQSMGLGRRQNQPAVESGSLKQIESPPIQAEPLTAAENDKEDPKTSNENQS